MSKHEKAFCRMRFLQNSAQSGSEMGEFNFATKPSKSGEQVILSLYGKESLNHGKTYHAAFQPVQAKIAAFRMRFDAERVNKMTSLEFDNEYNEWADSYESFLESKANQEALSKS